MNGVLQGFPAAMINSLRRGIPRVTFTSPFPAKWKVLRVIWVDGSPMDCREVRGRTRERGGEREERERQGRGEGEKREGREREERERERRWRGEGEARQGRGEGGSNKPVLRWFRRSLQD
jgi:hypothetical protein